LQIYGAGRKSKKACAGREQETKWEIPNNNQAFVSSVSRLAPG
jgi:hypothetical protein